MKITILNGDNNSNGNFTGYIRQLSGTLSAENTVEVFDLNKMNLKFCTGCWSCWWKTPGECAIKDDAGNIFRSVINSDLLIFASPLTAGFTSSELKKITDRLIVLIHPYTEIRNEEFHHKKRYGRYPEIAVIVEKNSDTDDEDLEIISDIYKRLAINFHSSLKFFKTTNDAWVKEISQAITSTKTEKV